MEILDWFVLLCYVTLVLGIGLHAGRSVGDANEHFLAGRTIPVWIATLSFAATVQSAATFIGGPEMVFRNDLRHLARFFGSISAAFIVAYLFIPAIYNSGKTTVYGILEDRFGRTVQKTASCVYLIGISLSAGARLFIAAVAFALVLFGGIHTGAIVTTILIVGTIGIIYTALGGMRAVAWTDVLQSITYITAAVVSVFVLLALIPVSWQESLEILQTGRFDGGSKLRFFDWRWDIQSDDTFWASLVGLCAFHVALFSTQQDLVQRLLACPSAKAARTSLIRGMLVIFAFSLVFALIGLLIFVYYQSSGLSTTDTRKIYPEFILNHIPAGLRGLIVAGIFAAAMSSMDSAVNSMAATFTCDILKKGNKTQTTGSDKAASLIRQTRHYRWSILALGSLLITVSCSLALIQSSNDRELFDFAVMAAFYGLSGLFGVLATALLTNRGNPLTAFLALFSGGIAVGFCARLPDVLLYCFDIHFQLGFPWWIVVGITVSFLICVSGNPKHGRKFIPTP